MKGDKKETEQLNEALLSFFESLKGLGPLLRMLSRPDLEVTLELRGSRRRIFLGLVSNPVEIKIGGAEIPFLAGMSVAEQDLHRIFLGHISLIDGIGERRVLLRGGLPNLLAFFPVIELARSLYVDHLLAKYPTLAPPLKGGKRLSPFGIRRRGAVVFEKALAPAFQAQGRFLAGLPPKEALELVQALATGVEEPFMQLGEGRFGREAHRETRHASAQHPLEDLPMPPGRRALLDGAVKTMHGLGQRAGKLKYTYGVPVTTLKVLEGISQGVEKAFDKAFR